MNARTGAPVRSGRCPARSSSSNAHTGSRFSSPRGARDAWASSRLLPPPEGRRTRWLPPAPPAGARTGRPSSARGGGTPPLHIQMFGPLLAWTGDGEVQRVGQFPAVPGADGPLGAAVRCDRRAAVTSALDAGPTWISHRRLLPWVSRRALVTVPLVILKASSLRVW